MLDVCNGQTDETFGYRYQGEDYYIRYTPAATENCYDYVTKTVTNDGDITEGEFCR